MIDNGFHVYQNMTDEEYRQMRMAESGEDISYKREMTEPEDMQNEHFYPDEKPVSADAKSNPEGTFDPHYGFVVLLPHEMIRIPQDSKDKSILELRMKGRTLQEIADVVDYETPSAVKKRIDRIAEQYETFINPLPEGAERPKPEKKTSVNDQKKFLEAGKTVFLKPMGSGGRVILPDACVKSPVQPMAFFCASKFFPNGIKKNGGEETYEYSMDKLLAAREKAQEKLRRAQEEENQIRKRIVELQRNERTHRLCNRGGYLEKLLDELGAPDLSDEEVFEHLKYALNTPYAKKHLENLVETKREKAAAAGENEVMELAD